jgi:hypothetical protein
MTRTNFAVSFVMMIRMTLLVAGVLTAAGCRGTSNTTEQNQNPGAAGAETAAPKLGAPDPNTPNPNGAAAAVPMGPDPGAGAGVNTSTPPSSAVANGANTPATISGTARAGAGSVGREAGSAGVTGGQGSASGGVVGGATGGDIPKGSGPPPASGATGPGKTK